MDDRSTPLLALLMGKAVPYTRPGSCSAIDKQAVTGTLRVTATGLVGDEQGDSRVHGGPDKAIHHYPWDHYTYWRTQLDHPLLAAPGAFGENFSTQGWTEHNVCFGDIVRAGSAVLQVSQGRQPCWKLNDRFGAPRMASWAQGTGRMGWYYKVLEPGEVSAGAVLTRLERPYPAWPLSKLTDLLFHRTLDRPLLEAAHRLPLPASWSKLVQRRLERNAVESWDARLSGPPGEGEGEGG